MKTILVGINAKYSHQNLAIEYIRGYSNNKNIKCKEFNINQTVDDIYRELLEIRPDAIGFSTYIWNYAFVERLTSDLKKALPQLVIFWGGPEVSFDSFELMSKNPAVDFIVRGEGEETVSQLVQSLEEGRSVDDILGISFRKDGKIVINDERPLIKNLDTIPSPFKNYKATNGKMVYFEMSRGCPFKCAYCLSSTIKGVRYFSKDRIKEDLLRIIDSGADTVKLVDRTFNANEDFSIEIMSFIIENAKEGMCFHMELMAHLISDKFLDFLQAMPKGLFQFEIGIQSSNEKTLKAINRATNLDKLAKSVKKIKSYGNIHQHIDLIVGLPYEDMNSFKNSFNYAYSLGVEKLQIGFLKMLRGSKLRKMAEEFGLVYSDYPSYEIIKNSWLSPFEVRKLKILEDVVEKFYNEDYFENTINYLVDLDNPYLFFEDFANFWEQNSYQNERHSRVSLYERFADFINENYPNKKEEILEVLRFDFLTNQNSPAKDFLNPKPIDLKEYHDLVKDQKLREKFSLTMEETTKKLVKDFKFEEFVNLSGQRSVYGFYYHPRGINILDITKEYERIINGIYQWFYKCLRKGNER